MKKEMKSMLLLLFFAVLFFLTSRPATATGFFDPHGNYEADTSGCAVCHFSHYSTGSPLLTKTQEKKVCYSCHDGSGSIFDVKAAFGEAVEGSSTKTSYHPVPTGAMKCVDCHNPHLTPSEKPGILSVGDSGIASGNAVCGACHGSGSLLPGGDMITPITGTPHDSGISSPASGTGIKCIRCHQPHGSPFDMLLQETVHDEKGVGRSVTGNNNTVCFGCHAEGLRTYKGESVFTQVKHGSTGTSTKAKSVYPGTAYSPGMCLNCHEPHGKTGFSNYTRESGNTLCVSCHDVPPANYSYRGITPYNNTPHAAVEGPTGARDLYTAGSQGFTVWEGLQDQTPNNPGQLVESGVTPLLAQDSSYLRTDLAVLQDDFNTQMYRFKLTENMVTYSKITPKWVGYGEPTVNHPTQLSIWNNTLNSGTGGWELLQSSQMGTQGVFEVARTNPNDYINAQGEVYLLAGAKHDATAPVISNLQETSVKITEPYTIRVSWNTNESAKSWIDFGTTTEFGTTLANATFKTSHSFDMTGLAKNVTYYYRVRSEDALGNLAVSATRSFQLIDPPAAPTLVTHGDIWFDQVANFTWNKTPQPTVQYKVQVSSVSNFSSLITESAWLNDNGATSQSWSTVTWHIGTVYWRVKARYSTHPLLESVSATSSYVSFSCPVLYTWNGEKFVYVTDLVAGSNVGLQIGPGKYLQPDPDDHALIPGDMLAEKDGYYTIKLKNELNEIDYVDNLVLQVVDHPIGTKIALNDFVRLKEPFTIYTYSEKVRPLKSATYVNNPTYSGGEMSEPEDVTELVSRLDDRHAIGKLSDDNQFTFDLGNLKGAQEVKLIVTGWTEFMNQPERAERIEKGKKGIKAAKDLVEVLQPDGSWNSKDIKHILGHTKTAVIDLTGMFAEDTEQYIVRLRGLYRPHLDFVGVDTTPQAKIVTTDLDPVSAELSYGGLAERSLYPSPYYDYYTKLDITIQHEGRFTRYGDVLPLLKEIDDRLIVMDSGDELTVNYKALPAPAPGMTRSYVIKPFAYYKELGAAVVDPMPFRGMDVSLLPESLGEYPEELQQYVEEWNTRIHPTEQGELENAGFFETVRLFFFRVVNWLQSLLSKILSSEAGVANEATTDTGHEPHELEQGIGQEISSLHYSLNANYIELLVEGTVAPGVAGECVNCHAVHGTSGVPKQLVSVEPFLCFGNGAGCHTEPINSATGTMSKANFISATGATSRHSIDPVEQAALGTKVLCSNCHNPHLNNPQNKTVNPDNTSVVLNQWVDRGIGNYINTDGTVYLLARAKHDGTPPIISHISHTVDSSVHTATIYWQTNEVATRQLEYIITPEGYTGTVPDAVYNHVYTIGNSTTFYQPNVTYSTKLTNMQWGYEYRYRIRAEDRINNVAYSSNPVFDRSVRLTHPPTAPQNLRTVPSTFTSGLINYNVRMEWDAAQDPGNHPLQYNVFLHRSDIYGNVWTTYSGWLPVGQTYWDTTLSGEGWYTYTWRVKAKNIHGQEGPWSSSAQFGIDHGGASSCPVLYTWDGNKYEFISDIVTGSNVGLAVAPGKYLKPMPDEQIVIPGEMLKEKDGFYNVIIKNELDEVDFVDNLQLDVVDHPVGTKIALNHFVRLKEPYRVYTYSEDVRPVKKATYIHNPTYSGGSPSPAQDITELVSQIDNHHASGPFGDDNQFILNLGDLKNAEEIRLVLVGWTEFVGGEEKENRANLWKRAPDLLEVLQPDGNWITEDIKFTPGHTKTAVIDLTGKFADDTQEYIVRLRGLYRPHLDFVGVDTTPQKELTVTEAELADAVLDYRGIAQRTMYPSPYYDYYDLQNRELKHEGRFTRYGDVLPLVQEVDDMLVVMDTGDELTVRFKALPPPETGMTRSFVLRPWAYYKEHTAAKVEPMPFRDMDLSNFPKSLGKYPKELQQYVKEWNTRVHPPSSPDQETGFLARLKNFLRNFLEWVKGFWDDTDGKQKGNAKESGGSAAPLDQETGQLPAVFNEGLPEHYSLNTNFARVSVGTTTGNYSYYPNSAGSEAWESNVMPTFSSPGTPATAIEKDYASTAGSSVWSTDLAGADEYNYQFFKFTVSQPLSSINKLAVRWTGYGEPTPNYFTTLYIWNVATQTWQQLLNGLYYQPTTADFFRNKENSAFCNRCHDNNAPAGVLMGTTPPSNIATSVTNDYHGDYRGTKGTLLPPYAKGSGRLACDDCHDPHGNNNVYHIRDQVNFVGGISMTKTTGEGAKALCQACHTGGFVTDWHLSCHECHQWYTGGGSHYNAPVISEALLNNCFRCHGHNRGFTTPTGCEGSGCHGDGIIHNYPRAF